MKQSRCGFFVFFILLLLILSLLCFGIFRSVSPEVSVPEPLASPEIIRNEGIATPMDKPAVYFPETLRAESAEEVLYNVPLSAGEQRFLNDCCIEYGVPTTLALGIMGVESGYKSVGISSTGDWGVMQINESNHKWLSRTLGVSDFLDYEQNVRAGVYMLSRYWEKYCNFDKTAMCYKYGDAGAQIKWENGITSDAYTEKFNRIVSELEKTAEG